MAILSVRLDSLKKRLGPNQALAGLSTDFEASRLHGIIGPDGAGKTTLLRHLVGLLKADAGTLQWVRDCAPVPFASVKDKVAYMPQTQSLYGDLTVSEHMDFFAEMYALERNDYQARRDQLLRITRLERFTDRPASKLSGGMYKKLGLMCALLADPDALLLDEPTNGVDPVSRREFWELLMDLLKKKIVILVATAYMDEAERCDKVHLVDKGRLLASGEPRELLRKAGAKRFDEIFLAAQVPA
ncbi:MAG: ABC transporter ATP-binding protein [bacterium]